MARGGVLAAIVVLALGGGAFVYSWEPPIDPLPRAPEAGTFDPALVKRGSELAAIGNCGTCHTAAGGESYAGGLGIETPFGTIYATNLTPDEKTGIGLWSQEAFDRAMRSGVDRAGNHLYPAFPYDHFTRVSEDHNRALYAFLMTRRPVEAEAPANDLTFPLGFRPLIAGWKLLFLDEGAYEPDPEKTVEWNRGAYLAEGLAHCGACHTPRNALGAAESGEHYAGGSIDGWHAYALDETSPSPIPWTAESLAFYLRHGWHENHGVSRGPMAPVTTNLATVPEADTTAIAVYVADRMGTPSPERAEQAKSLLSATRSPDRPPAAADSQSPPPDPVPADHPGAQLYAAACASCHNGQRPLPLGGIDLRLSTGISGPTPENTINVVLDGLPVAPGQSSPIMPGFDGAISDQQLVDLLAYMRERFSDKEPWADVEGYVRARRQNGASVEAMHGKGAAPADPSQKVMPW